MTVQQPIDPQTGMPMPPTQPDAMYLPRQPTSWPKVIGIIAIILGSLGILGACGGALSTASVDFLQEMLEEMAPPGQSSAFGSLEALREWKGPLVVGHLLGMALAGLLLFVGIGLLKRRAGVVRLVLFWALAKIPFEIASSIFNYIIQKPYLEETVEQSAATPGLSDFFQGAFAVGVLFSILMYSALPVFLLIWFRRARIKAEVAQWT